MYRSINEPNTFNFHDSELLHTAVQDGDMFWTVDWAGVCPENSAHPSERELRTEHMLLTFRNFCISRVRIYGCSSCNAQGEIVQRTLDRELTKPQIRELLVRLQGYENWCANLLYGGGRVTEDGVCVEMELDEECAENGFYLMEIRCEAFVAEWEQYSDTQC